MRLRPKRCSVHLVQFVTGLWVGGGGRGVQGGVGSSGAGRNLPLFRWGILTQGAMVEPWEPQVQHAIVGKVLILWVIQALANVQPVGRNRL